MSEYLLVCGFLQIFKGLRGAQMLENMGFGDFVRYAFLGVSLNREHLPVTDTGAKFSRCGTGRNQHLLVESLVRQQLSFGSPQTLSHALGSVQNPVILSYTTTRQLSSGGQGRRDIESPRQLLPGVSPRKITLPPIPRFPPSQLEQMGP